MVERTLVPRNCDVDWRAMGESEDAARMCDRCSTPVHDLSAMDPEAARALLRSPGRVCVRYLHDARGQVVHGEPPQAAQIIPASALLSASARRKWMAIASLAATTVLLEACGDTGYREDDDAGARDAAAD